MASQRDLAVVAAYVVRYNRLRTRNAAAVGQLWDRLAGLDDDRAASFAAAAATATVAAQTTVGATVDGYLATLADSDVTGIDPATFTGPAARNGADPVDVYLRGVVTARVGISEGLPFNEAMRLGRLRVVSAAETDVALAQRAATVQALDGKEGVVGYRRVLTGKSCALCATASTQRYHRGDLMPIHSHCDCGIAPIIGTEDPGHVINQKLVADLKNAAGQDPAYWANRRVTVTDDGDVHLPDIATHEHGELGRVLTDADHDFTGPSDIAA